MTIKTRKKIQFSMTNKGTDTALYNKKKVSLFNGNRDGVKMKTSLRLNDKIFSCETSEKESDLSY